MEKYTNKQKFWLSFMAILMIGLWLISYEIKTAWINTPIEYEFTFNVNADNKTKESLNSIARVSESQDQQCIIKEYIEITDKSGNKVPALINEYIAENCSYTK